MALRIDATKNKGRGVFATTRISAGELIERAPVHVVSKALGCYIEKIFLADYLFWWGDELALPFGHFILYNHSYSPNALFVIRLDDLIIELVALRDIGAGEEILFNYNGDPKNDQPVWFEVKE